MTSLLVEERPSESEIFNVPELKIVGLLTLMSSIEIIPFVFSESPIVTPPNDSERLFG